MRNPPYDPNNVFVRDQRPSSLEDSAKKYNADLLYNLLKTSREREAALDVFHDIARVNRRDATLSEFPDGGALLRERSDLLTTLFNGMLERYTRRSR